MQLSMVIEEEWDCFFKLFQTIRLTIRRVSQVDTQAPHVQKKAAESRAEKWGLIHDVLAPCWTVTLESKRRLVVLDDQASR